MVKVALAGTKNSVNKTFTLSQASVGITLVVWTGRILKSVASNPGQYEYVLSADGLTVTTGTAPAAADALYAYIQTTVAHSLEEVTLVGQQNGLNTVFVLSKVPPTGTNILFARNGILLEQVASAPTSVQFTISGTVVTLGLAPVVADRLRPFIAVPATAMMVPLTVRGNQDSANTRYEITSYAPPLSTDPVILTTIDGVLQTRTLTPPISGQFIQVNPTVLVLGTAPAAATSLQFILIGSIPAALNPYQFTCSRVANRVSIFLQRGLDTAEVEEVVSQVYREYVDMYQWSFLQVDGVLATEPPKAGGTVAVAEGSRVVSGTSTSFSLADIGKRFRLGSSDQSYIVRNVDEARQRLEIQPAYVGTTASGQTYELIKTTYSLGPDVEYLFSIAGQYRLREISPSVLNLVDPTRTSSSNQPTRFAYTGKNARGETEIEIYPVPSRATVLRYVGIRRDVCTEGSHILKGIESLIVNAAAAGGCRIMLLKPNQKIAAEVLLNLSNTYEQKTAQLLERLDALDWTRSDVAKIQGLVGDEASYDGKYAATHDVGLLGEEY